MVNSEKEDNEDLRRYIEQVSYILEQPDKFAKVFCNAIENSVPMNAAIGKVVISLLEKDRKVENRLKETIKEVETEDWRNRVKKIGVSVWTIMVAVIASVGTFLITKAIG